ncbi:MAG: class I SAM-dependent methyltransferase, partial [Bacteroidota bacterium]
GDWLEKIPRDRRVLIIAEGILEYISEADVKILFNRITRYFLHGQIIFDVMNSFAIKSGNEKLKVTTGAVLKWAVDYPSAVDRLNPKMKRMKVLSVFHSRYMHKLSPGLRLLIGFASLFPQYRNMIRLMRYKF